MCWYGSNTTWFFCVVLCQTKNFFFLVNLLNFKFDSFEWLLFLFLLLCIAQIFPYVCLFKMGRFLVSHKSYIWCWKQKNLHMKFETSLLSSQNKISNTLVFIIFAYITVFLFLLLQLVSMLSCIMLSSNPLLKLNKFFLAFRCMFDQSPRLT